MFKSVYDVSNREANPHSSDATPFGFQNSLIEST